VDNAEEIQTADGKCRSGEAEVAMEAEAAGAIGDVRGRELRIAKDAAAHAAWIVRVARDGAERPGAGVVAAPAVLHAAYLFQREVRGDSGQAVDGTHLAILLPPVLLLHRHVGAVGRELHHAPFGSMFWRRSSRLGCWRRYSRSGVRLPWRTCFNMLWCRPR